MTFNIFIRDLCGEMLGTFIFVTIFLIITRKETNKVYCIAIENFWIYLTIAASLHASRSITSRSGGALNPALALGLDLFFSIKENDYSHLINFYIFLIGPSIGGVLAAFYYMYVHVKAF